MKQLFLSVLLTILFVQAKSQNYILPTILVDSMIFEVRKGRECTAALQTSIQAISALQISEGEKGRLITLQSDQLKNYALLDQNWSLRLTNQSDLFMIEKSDLKKKIRKRNKFIAGQGLVIAVLLALIL